MGPTGPMGGVTPAVVGLLAQLVAINSVNGSMHEGPGEGALAAFVADYRRGPGPRVAGDEVLPGRPNASLSLPADTAAGPRPAPAQGGGADGAPVRRLLLDVHLDTVPQDEMPQALTPRIEGG